VKIIIFSYICLLLQVIRPITLPLYGLQSLDALNDFLCIIMHQAWRCVACYSFVKTKLASRHPLLYV